MFTYRSVQCKYRAHRCVYRFGIRSAVDYQGGYIFRAPDIIKQESNHSRTVFVSVNDVCISSTYPRQRRSPVQKKPYQLRLNLHNAFQHSMHFSSPRSDTSLFGCQGPRSWLAIGLSWMIRHGAHPDQLGIQGTISNGAKSEIFLREIAGCMLADEKVTRNPGWNDSCWHRDCCLKLVKMLECTNACISVAPCVPSINHCHQATNHQ